MTEKSQEPPKIIVDSDWKAQVEAEREALRRREQAAASAGGKPSEGSSAAGASAAGASAAGAGGGAAPGKAADDEREERLPPASFALLVSSLATQAMMSLGQFPDPFENKPVVRLEAARHTIDMLAVLEEKTKGNLTPDEQAMLAHVLTDLRMAYVAMKPK